MVMEKFSVKLSEDGYILAIFQLIESESDQMLFRETKNIIQQDAECTGFSRFT